MTLKEEEKPHIWRFVAFYYKNKTYSTIFMVSERLLVILVRHSVYMYSSWSFFSMKVRIKLKWLIRISDLLMKIDKNTPKSIPFSTKLFIFLYQNLYLIDTNCGKKCHTDRGVQYPCSSTESVYTTCKSICLRFHSKTHQTEQC